MSRLPDLQEAVRALHGVAHASVRWPEPGGPATLHIVFEEGADRDEATLGVLHALRAGDVDLTTLRAQVPPPPGGPSPAWGHEAPLGAWAPASSPAASPGHNGAAPRADVRPVFSKLAVERTSLDNSVTVTLRLGERVLTGRADGLATRRATPRTAAAAALLALRDALPDDTRVQLEWLEVVDADAPDRPTVVQSAVACLTPSSEETYVGSAIVRDDLREAAVRATLDALNRRLGRLVPAAG